jgi:hypothetical protein
MKTHKPASLYLHGQEDPAARVVPGLKCVLDNISDTGCAVTIGGKAVPGLRVEIQFALDTSPVTVCGTVRSVNYNEDANRSVLHIEADPLSPDVRNEILGEIFGTQDDDEVLPFRIMEEPHQDGEGGGAPAGGGLFTEVELHDIPNDTVVNEV